MNPWKLLDRKILNYDDKGSVQSCCSAKLGISSLRCSFCNNLLFHQSTVQCGGSATLHNPILIWDLHHELVNIFWQRSTVCGRSGSFSLKISRRKKNKMMSQPTLLQNCNNLWVCNGGSRQLMVPLPVSYSFCCFYWSWVVLKENEPALLMKGQVSCMK